jgi:hypothetical protein
MTATIQKAATKNSKSMIQNIREEYNKPSKTKKRTISMEVSFICSGNEDRKPIVEKDKDKLSQTEAYLKLVETNWRKNFEKSYKIINELTGLDFKNDKFTVFVTNPNSNVGHYLGNNKIIWGHKEKWENYSTVYIWHEILHSKIRYNNEEDHQIGHSIIELVTDYELRKRLNGGKYEPFEKSRPMLLDAKRKILPYWKEYLKSDDKNIIKFYKYCKTLKSHIRN